MGHDFVKRIALIAVLLAVALGVWRTAAAQQPFTVIGNGQICSGELVCSPLSTPAPATLPTHIDAYNIIGSNRAVNVWCNLGDQVVVLEQRANRVMVGCAGVEPTSTLVPTETIPPTPTFVPTLTPTEAPTVVWTPTATATGVLTVTTLNLQVASGNDDAHEAETGYGFTVSDPNLLIQAAANNYDRWWAGLRFDGVTIPQGATITSASLQTYKTSSNDILATIYAEDVDDADDFSTTADVSGRTLTTASATWTDSSGTVSDWVTSADISSVIQEIVDRGSWASGNALVVIVAGRANGSNVSGFIRSYNGDTIYAAKLDIEYTTGADYTLSTDAGSYAVTGQAASLTANRKLVADAGGYDVTGQAATLTAARILSTDAGSYSVSGQDASLVVSRLLSTEAGSYALSGLDVSLTYTPVGGPTYTLTIDAGSYELSGQAVSLIAARILSTEAGAYSITGQDANLLRGYLLEAAQGSYSITGQDATLLISRILSGTSGNYAISGKAVTFIYSGEEVPVTPDSRIYVVDTEDRIFVVVAENRTYTVQ